MDSSGMAQAADATRAETAAGLEPQAADTRKQATERAIVDGTGLVAGRLASNVAKMLLGGRQVVIINCENVMISGTRSNIIKEYREFLEIHSILNPKHGPFHPRRPDTIMARMVRGMLPRKKPSGRSALSRLRTYVGTPKGLGSKRTAIENAKIRRPAPGYVTMGDLGRTVGWT